MYMCKQKKEVVRYIAHFSFGFILIALILKTPSFTLALQQVAQGRRVVLQWIPAHCGVRGNERAY